MSLRTLEMSLVIDARALLRNSRIRLKDLLEWSTGVIEPRFPDTEIVVRLPHGMYVCLPKSCDKRKK